MAKVPAKVPNSRDGPVPEELNLSNRQPSLVPSSEEGYGVTVSRMCEAKVSCMQKLDDMRRKMCVAQLSLSNVCNVTEQDVPSRRNLRSTGIAKPVTGKFANTKPEDIQSGSSPFKRKYKHNNIQNIHYNACNLVSKQREDSKSNLIGC